MSEQREQRKSKIKTNTVWEHRDPGNPIPAKGIPPSSSSGARHAQRAAPSGRFPPGATLRAACTCVSTSARLLAHAGTRAYASTNSSQVGREAAGPPRGPLGHSRACAAPLSRPQPVCISVPSPRLPAPYQLLAGPGLFNHSCPLSWLRGAAAPLPTRWKRRWKL